MATNLDYPDPYRNRFDMDSTSLAELAIIRGEGRFSDRGSVVVTTGERTGRSPKDRFIVKDSSTVNHVFWGDINQPISEHIFSALWNRVSEYMLEEDNFVSELHVGAHPEHYLPLQVKTQYAWHALFARSMFIEASEFNPKNKPVWEVLSAPEFICKPKRDRTLSECSVMIDLTGRRILIVGMRYGGELKKALFSVLNYLLPEFDILPMHCSANRDSNGHVTLFFGLSGTGKTTLSADLDCHLIGDDEHGWGEGTVFNFEGGCYAKCINLSADNEPMIYDALRFGSILENVVLDHQSRKPIFSDDSMTENTRACYPRQFIEGCIPENAAGEPDSIMFLTCDVSGVLPPVSILSPEAAAYHFLSGYTAKVGSTEVGTTDAYTETFSACFGEPFFPRAPHVYADLLIRRIRDRNCQVYLINTGWSSGSYPNGKRFGIPITRAIIRAARTGNIDLSHTKHLADLNLTIPLAVAGVDSKVLDPRQSWADPIQYDQSAQLLVSKFKANFDRFEVAPQIVAAGPQ